MIAAGYFGKVLTRGDFVARRLSPGFVLGWDGWLQAGLQHSRQQLGARWLDMYLSSPIWHFAIAAGLCGDEPVAGVMIPSVDRVGRYFPLTLAGVMEGDGQLLPELFERGAGWFDALERLALGSLADGFSLEDMDASLVSLAPDRAPQCAEALQGRAVFWTQGSPCVAPSVMVCGELPSPDAYCGMMGGGG